MTLKERQAAFDREKWNDGVASGKDMCGTYEFCGKCCKDEKYPCARAEARWKRGGVRIAVIRRRT